MKISSINASFCLNCQNFHLLYYILSILPFPSVILCYLFMCFSRMTLGNHTPWTVTISTIRYQLHGRWRRLKINAEHVDKMRSDL